MSHLDGLFGIRALFRSGVELVTRGALDFVGPGWSAVDNPVTGRTELTFDAGVLDAEADEVSYDPTASGLEATEVQAALDEVVGLIGEAGALPYDSAPSGLGAASPGEVSEYARGDHVHQIPTLGQIVGIGADASGTEITNVGVPNAPASAARLSDISTLVPNVQTGTSYTLAVSDAGKCIECDNASAFTLTIPKVSVVAIPVNTIIYLYQKGAGQITVSPVDGTVTIDTNARFASKSAGQSAMLMLWHRASNVWTLTGEREAV